MVIHIIYVLISVFHTGLKRQSIKNKKQADLTNFRTLKNIQEGTYTNLEALIAALKARK